MSQVSSRLDQIDFNGLENYKSDPLIICYKKFISRISGVSHPNDDDEEQDVKTAFDFDEWYPYCNSYYPYSEHIDAFARTNHLLSSKVPPSVSSRSNGYAEKQAYRKFFYSTRDCQIDYLLSKPLSFLILGKPSIGEEELGKQLAEYWQSVYIDPETLIREEIEFESRAGQCIEFNLRCGRAIGIDVILRLVEKRMKTESVAHRGFVLCGLPIIANDLYEEDPVSAESAIFTVHEIFEELLDSMYDMLLPPPAIPAPSRVRSTEELTVSVKTSKIEWDEQREEDIVDINKPRSSINVVPDDVIPLDLGDSKRNVCEPPEIGINYEEQLNFIMNLIDGPLLIIYMVCENQDVINKRNDYRYDIYSETLIDIQRERAEKSLLSFFTQKNRLGLGVTNPPVELFDDIPRLLKDSSELIHLVRLPADFPANVQVQLQHFNDIAAKILEAKILEHNPEHFLKVDGRTSISRMFTSVKWKLRVFNTHKVLIPEKILVANALDVEGEGGDIDPQKKANYDNLDECFRIFSKKKVVNPMFKWLLGDWGTRCPVAMAEGSYVDGDPTYAVNFMNTIFFLSSQDAFVKFQRNPRPFLLPPNPRSHGKIFVVGPGCSGKSAVSNCLGYLLNCTVLSPADLCKKFIDKKRDNLYDRMKQAMITDRLNVLNTEQIRCRQMEQHFLEEKINIWLERFRQYIAGEVSRIQKGKSEGLTITSFPVMMAVQEEEKEEESNFEGIYLTEDAAQDLSKNPQKMRLYLPEEYRREIPDMVPVTALSDTDLRVIENFLSSADTDEIILGEEDLFDMYGTAIRDEEEEYTRTENIKGGWILDGFSYDFNFFQRVFDECPPEHIIILEDSSRGEYLLDRYKNRGSNIFTDYHSFFQSIGKPEIANKISSNEPANFKETIVKDILNDILNTKAFLIEPEDEEDISETTLLSRRFSQINYRTELEEFDENKLKIESFLTSMKKDYIIIDVNDKTLDNLLEEVVLKFEDKYRASAVAFSDIDRLEESRDFGNNTAAEGDGEGMNQRNGDEFQMNRHYGDTFNFCPVSLHDKWVLWKGREEHIARYLGKVYLCCNETDLEAFIRDPRKYIPINKPFPSFPPPRICVTGFTGSGKTSISKAISKNFALCYSSFMEFMGRTGNQNESNEKYQQIQDYLGSDIPLPEEIIQEYMDSMWFKEHFNKSMGFVVDDFPKRPSDVAAMVKSKAIPDIIINLKVSEKELRNRSIQKHLSEWNTKMDQEHAQQKEKHSQIVMKWEQDRRERFEQLMEVRRQDRYSAKRQDKQQQETKPSRPYMEDLDETDDETDKTIRSKSQVTFDSVEEQEDMDEVNKQLLEEMPEPLFVTDTESIEEATERIKLSFEDTYVKENEFLKSMKDLCLAAQILWADMKAEKQLDVAQFESFLAVEKFNFRNKSFFERTYEVSIELAERLLANGYFFLSMFGRTCPVQYFKKDIPIQLFIPMEQTFNVFPIIHRQYIYFVVGKVNRNAFREDPLKYVDLKTFNFPLLPIRLAVIGPPKCGKSALADRFRTELGLKVISKGQAARYVMNYLAHSALGESMETKLRSGLVLKEKMVLNCVEAATFDPRAVTQGVLMDGFPNSAREVKYLTSMGLMPQLVIDLYTDDPSIYAYVSSEALKLFEPPYSKHFMQHRYNIWESDQKQFRCWLDREYQNIVRIPIDTCMWNIWDQAFDSVKAAIYEIKHYHIHAKDNWPLRLSYMLVSPLEFLERQSSYKIYCPCCLYFHKELVSSNFPPDRTGLVHFRKYFYYICPKHIDEFLETPDRFLPPYNPNKLPNNLPERVKLSVLPKDLHEDGYCVICYKDHEKAVKGNIEYASIFEGTVYLFDMQKCLEKFMTSPQSYFDNKVILKDNIHYPSLSYKDLPPLGTLEQFVARDVISAIKSTASIRPVIPGLSVEQSALVSVAMFLKMNNKKVKVEDAERYKIALDVMLHRRKTLLELLEVFKNNRNPFIYYEEPVPALRISEWIKKKFRRDVPSWSYTDIKEDKAFNRKRHQSGDYEDLDYYEE